MNCSLGVLVHPAQPVSGPHIHALEQIHLLEHAHVAGRSLAVQPNLGPKLGVVAHLTGHLGQAALKVRQLVELDDVGQVWHIAGNQRVEVLARPGSAPARRRARKSLGVAPLQHDVD